MREGLRLHRVAGKEACTALQDNKMCPAHTWVGRRLGQAASAGANRGQRRALAVLSRSCAGTSKSTLPAHAEELGRFSSAVGCLAPALAGLEHA